MASDQEKEAPGSGPLKFVRSQDFEYLYANNVLTHATAWDVRLAFGRFEEADAQTVVKQKVEVTLSFGLAKLTLYWLQAAIIAHEIETGRSVTLRPNVRPDPPKALGEEEAKNPALVKFYEAMKKLHDEFIASME